MLCWSCSSHALLRGDSKSCFVTYPSIWKSISLALLSESLPTLIPRSCLSWFPQPERYSFLRYLASHSIVYFCVKGATLRLSGKRKEKAKNSIDCACLFWFSWLERQCSLKVWAPIPTPHIDSSVTRLQGKEREKKMQEDSFHHSQHAGIPFFSFFGCKEEISPEVFAFNICYVIMGSALPLGKAGWQKRKKKM